MIRVLEFNRGVTETPRHVAFDVDGVYIKFLMYTGKLVEVARYKNHQVFDRGSMDIPAKEYNKLKRQALAILKGGK